MASSGIFLTAGLRGRAIEGLASAHVLEDELDVVVARTVKSLSFCLSLYIGILCGDDN